MSRDDVYLGVVTVVVILASVGFFFLALVPTNPLGLGHYRPPAATAPATPGQPSPSLTERRPVPTSSASPTQRPTQPSKTPQSSTQGRNSASQSQAKPTPKVHRTTPVTKPTPQASSKPLIDLPTVVIKLPPLLPPIEIP